MIHILVAENWNVVFVPISMSIEFKEIFNFTSIRDEKYSSRKAT